MKLKEIISAIEKEAPPVYQESYDNARLITGDFNMEISSALICLDCLEEVVEEAITKKCNLILAHHPIVFGGLKSLTGRNYVERVVIKAIKNDIAIYAAHTNLDNVRSGVNAIIANRLGLKNTTILAPKGNLLSKLFVFCPKDHAEKVRHAIFDAGAGNIGKYDQCSFNLEGTGTFRGGEGTDPFVGQVGKVHQEDEVKIEAIFPSHIQHKVVNAMVNAHPYEEVAFDVVKLENSYAEVGSGMMGILETPMDEKSFIEWVKKQMNVKVVRHTDLLEKPVKKVAVCGGSGSFLLSKAISAGADVYLSADFKYHEFFDAEKKILITDIGHYESEQFTGQWFAEILTKNFPTFAVHFTEIDTNPINYS